MTDDDIQKAARTARTAIADLVEAAMDEKRVDGQGVHYWSEVAKHSLARNDTLISQLKEKEKIAAQQEQRIASLQNEVLNQVYAGTQEDLKAELERVHAAAAEWERKFFATADELDRTREIAQDARKGQEAVQAELDAVKARYKEDEDIYIRTRESNNRLREQIKSLEQQIDFLQDENQRQAEASAPVTGKQEVRTYTAYEGARMYTMGRDEFYEWLEYEERKGRLISVSVKENNVVGRSKSA